MRVGDIDVSKNMLLSVESYTNNTIPDSPERDKFNGVLISSK